MLLFETQSWIQSLSIILSDTWQKLFIGTCQQENVMWVEWIAAFVSLQERIIFMNGNLLKFVCLIKFRLFNSVDVSLTKFIILGKPDLIYYFFEY